MSAAAAKLNPATVPDRPPAPTAGVVLEQRAAKELELELLQSRIGAVAYAAAIGGKPAADALTALHSQIQSAQFALACNEAGHAYALQADEASIADWWQQVHAL